jgi:NAD(P)-dependent dehydrogenase (short-subunit alcohol dehydrogenase family)
LKRYLITGASRGIGRAIAQKLASKETSLLLHGRDEKALNETCRAVEAVGCAATPLMFDLRRSEQISALVERVGNDNLDALINNAGIAVVKPLNEISLDEWQSIFAINVTAPFLLTQALAPRMQAGSSIVNVLSIAAKTGFPNWSSYCMSKFALEGFSQAIREELRPHGIRVINLYPAATNTEIWNNVAGDWPRDKMMLPTEIGDAVAYVLSRPPEVAIENLDVLNLTGRL